MKKNKTDILCKKSPTVVCGNDRYRKKNHIKSLKEKMYQLLKLTQNFVK